MEHRVEERGECAEVVERLPRGDDRPHGPTSTMWTVPEQEGGRRLRREFVGRR